MSEQLRESLSAAMDGEADAFELRRVLDESRNDPELRALWHRQHLVRSVMQGERLAAQGELRERILAEMSELENIPEEEAMVTPEAVLEAPPEKPRWTGRLAGTAVAAAVAVLVVLNGDLLTGREDGPGFVAPDTAQATQISGATSAPVMYDIVTPADRERTDALIVHHLQQNALNRPGGFSFVRLVSFDRQLPRDGARVQLSTEVSNANP